MSQKTISFHWTYIMLPAAILLLSVILAACFYRLLPGEVAYHFTDGFPDRWASRGAIIIWMLVPQFFLFLLATALVWGITKLGAYFRQVETTRVKPEKVLSLMGNMVALPQIILSFAMLDIFLYNSYQIHLMPVLVFALIIMGLGGIFLGIFFVQAMGWGGASRVKVSRSDSNDGTSLR